MQMQKSKTSKMKPVFFKQEVWPTEKFLSIETFEKNRVVEPRIKKLTKLLKSTDNNRLYEVAIGVATKPFNSEVSRYKKNDKFCIDGNARAEVWRRNPTLRPDYVCVKIYDFDTKEKADETYYTFDNTSAAETSSDKLSGLLRERNYVALSEPIRYGKMNTFLKKATRYAHDEDGLYLLTAPINKMLDFHWSELTFLDQYQEIFKKGVKNSCNIYSALLMIGKKYGVNHPRYIKLLDNYCNEITETNTKTDMDGVTYVFNTLYGKHKEIWGNNAYSVNKLPLFGKILFAFDSFMNDETIQKGSKITKKEQQFIDYYKNFYRQEQ
jgi:hypothetical protein